MNENIEINSGSLKKIYYVIFFGLEFELERGIEIIGESILEPENFEFTPISTKWMRSRSNFLEFDCESTRRKIKPSTKGRAENPPKTHKIIGDGNCLFRTLSHAITNSEEHHTELRKIICKEIQKSSATYLGTESAEDYFNRTGMQNETVWGTDLEISVAASLLNTSIWCYGPFGNGYGWTKFEPHNPKCGESNNNEAIFIVNKGQHYEPLYKW